MFVEKYFFSTFYDFRRTVQAVENYEFGENRGAVYVHAMRDKMALAMLENGQSPIYPRRSYIPGICIFHWGRSYILLANGPPKPLLIQRH